MRRPGFTKEFREEDIKYVAVRAYSVTDVEAENLSLKAELL